MFVTASVAPVSSAIVPAAVSLRFPLAVLAPARFAAEFSTIVTSAPANVSVPKLFAPALSSVIAFAPAWKFALFVTASVAPVSSAIV
ncbi:MAG: hypothetical protein AB7O31_14295, partial [Burkholderiales bacterium]